MGTFELDDKCCDDNNGIVSPTEAIAPDIKPIKHECIVALKVYDQCRQQDCLTSNIIGPARAAESRTIGDVTIREGDVITPPSDAASVTVERLRLKKIIIVDNSPNPFKPGYWDIDLKYVFVYFLVFRDAAGNIIGSIKANSIFNKKVTLFGSHGTDIVVGSNLFNNGNDTIDSDPNVFVEGKAVALAAELKYGCPCNSCCNDDFNTFGRPSDNNEIAAQEVLVTIGLFTIIKLVRIVSLLVESRGFCIPKKCEEASMNPCQYFDNLEFPLNVFSPPQIEDFR